jgi:hypothetical protein
MSKDNILIQKGLDELRRKKKNNNARSMSKKQPEIDQDMVNNVNK